MFKFGKKSLERLATTEPIVQEIAQEVLKRSEYDFGIPKYGGKRTLDEQKHLYDTGKSTIMTSEHLKGLALDICRYMGNNKYSFEKDDIKPIADIFKEVSKEKGVVCVWGGDWKTFIDAPHFQFEVSKGE